MFRKLGLANSSMMTSFPRTGISTPLAIIKTLDIIENSKIRRGITILVSMLKDVESVFLPSVVMLLCCCRTGINGRAIVKCTLCSMRENIDSYHKSWFEEEKKFARRRRTSSIQRNQANYEAGNYNTTGVLYMCHFLTTCDRRIQHMLYRGSELGRPLCSSAEVVGCTSEWKRPGFLERSDL